MENINKKVLLVMHQATSDPGRVGEAIRTRGFDLDMRVPAIGDPLPAHMQDHAAAVIFGGPMSANDDHESFIRQETGFIDLLLKSETPYLGICLGAQIMARALGARVAEHPDGFREIGYYQLTPTETTSPLFDKSLYAYQWHREGFEVPADGTLLAKSDIFTNQAYQVGKNAYGIQFHPEVTEAMNRRWATSAAHMLGDPGAQSIEKQLEGRRKYDAGLKSWLNKFLDHWLPDRISPTEARQFASETA
jgi:GMP synthase (glutamine-hydrolysing)